MVEPTLEPEKELTEVVLSGLRAMIGSISSEITEQIKSNSPCFIYWGEMKPFDPKEYKRDLLVVNLHRGSILLVFPTGSKVIQSGKLSGKDYPDGRKIVTIKKPEDFVRAQNELGIFMLDWFLQIEK